MKTCFKCGDEKPLTEFYKHKQMADGHLNKCKSCAKNDVFQHRHGPQFREKVLEYDRSRGNRQDKSYRDSHKEGNPHAYRARHALSNAVRDGKIERPDRCSHCHKICRPHGHHHDYSMPLSVTWLCPACHRQLHALLDTISKDVRNVAH